jgi:hypothetical protein
MLQSVALSPGLGKTHLAVGLARKAAEAGYRTYFTTAADLAARCHRAAIEGRWATTMRFFAGPGLLVIDELGYLPLPATLERLFSIEVSATEARRLTGRLRFASLPTPATLEDSAPSYSPSTATPTAYATTTPATTHSAPPPPAPANRYANHPHQVGNFDKQLWPRSLSGINTAESSDPLTPGCPPGRVLP